jgi:hypothetical protein
LLGNSRSKRATTRLTRFGCVDKIGPARNCERCDGAHVFAVELRLVCDLVWPRFHIPLEGRSVPREFNMNAALVEATGLSVN